VTVATWPEVEREKKKGTGEVSLPDIWCLHKKTHDLTQTMGNCWRKPEENNGRDGSSGGDDHRGQICCSPNKLRFSPATGWYSASAKLKDGVRENLAWKSKVLKPVTRSVCTPSASTSRVHIPAQSNRLFPTVCTVAEQFNNILKKTDENRNIKCKYEFAKMNKYCSTICKRLSRPKRVSTVHVTKFNLNVKFWEGLIVSK